MWSPLFTLDAQHCGLVVGDPCYFEGPRTVKRLIVKPGQWYFEIRRNSKNIPVSLNVTHEDGKGEGNLYPARRKTYLPVDSGQMAVVRAECRPTTQEKYEELYQQYCNASLNVENGYGGLVYDPDPIAVVSQTTYGDGRYELQTYKNDADEIVCLKITFDDE